MNIKTAATFVLAAALVIPQAAEGVRSEIIGSESDLGFDTGDGNGNGWFLPNTAV